jgi:hypothetical protein
VVVVVLVMVVVIIIIVVFVVIVIIIIIIIKKKIISMYKTVGTFRTLSAEDSSGIIYNRKFGDYLHNDTFRFLSYD